MTLMLDEIAAARRPVHGRSAVLLDSQPLLLDMVEHVLDSIDVETVAKATSADAALEAIREHRPDLFVLDLHACGDDAGTVAVIGEARTLVPTLRLVVLADTADERQIRGAFALGATAAVSRGAQPEDLAFAVRQAFKPSIFLPQLGGPIELPVADDPCAHDLTRREVDVLRLVALGYSNNRVARTLWVTEQTVKFHLSNVYRKLDVANRTEASRWAQLHGLLVDAPAEQQVA